jgi:hypothetical protein
MLRMARALAEAREQFSDNRAFSKWVKVSDLPLSKESRQALVQMGRHPEVTRSILMISKRRSYETIWRRELKPAVTSMGSSAETLR